MQGVRGALDVFGKNQGANPLESLSADRHVKSSAGVSTDSCAVFADSGAVLADLRVRRGEVGPNLAMLTQETIWRRPW